MSSRRRSSRRSSRRRSVASAAIAVASAAAVSAALSAGVASPAWAEPSTSIAYPSGAAATRFTGEAFDTCTAPSLATIQAWGASPYRGLAVYISGVTRSCRQPELTAAWVAAVSALKWRLIPIHKGLQPPCGGKPTDAKISPADAANQGVAAAGEAVTAAKALGILPGSAVYNDIENYSATDSAADRTCRTAVLTYLSGWTRRLHQLGYLSGVYANLSSGAPHLAGVYSSASYARPDAIWIARWDRNPALTGWSGIADAKWSVHQRAKQYRGDHDESYGGIALDVDNDRFDAPVATVAHPYQVTGISSLAARTAPSTSAAAVRRLARGDTVRVVCQTTGTKVSTTNVWDRLSDGTYVSDRYISTPSKTGYSAPLPRCAYPYQTTAPGGLTQHTGPGSSYASAGTLAEGALAWVVCQKAGSKVGTTSVWDRLENGRWVSDYYVKNPSNTGYSAPVPRC